MSPEIKAQRKKMQLEIILKESDVKKIDREKLFIEIALRDLKKKSAQIQTDLIVKESEMKKLVAEQMLIQNELIKMKHQMNGLR